MKKETIAYANIVFLIVTVGACLARRSFAQEVEVLEGSVGTSHFPTDRSGAPGYIKTDASLLRQNGGVSLFHFFDKVQDGIFSKVSSMFNSHTEIEGELADKVTLKQDGYEFSFQIKEYERDSDHHFEIIKPARLADIPEDERLGRVVYLTIKLDEDS